MLFELAFDNVCMHWEIRQRCYQWWVVWECPVLKMNTRAMNPKSFSFLWVCNHLKNKIGGKKRWLKSKERNNCGKCLNICLMSSACLWQSGAIRAFWLWFAAVRSKNDKCAAGKACVPEFIHCTACSGRTGSDWSWAECFKMIGKWICCF